MSTLAHTVTRTVVLAAPAERVWEAITDPAALSEWLAPEVELEAHTGGEIVCRFEDGEERRGEVELVEEAERLAFVWWREGAGPSRVELTLDAVAGATRLTVTETALAAPLSPTLLAAGWQPRLRALPLALGRLVLA
ncbi:MAG: SRPBCC domain-containing protein [Solirubrobacterales bacterium]